jgi:hypothetical protein
MVMAASRDERPGGLSEMHRKRRGRNIALALALCGLMVLFYVITIVKLGGQ